VIQNLRPLSLVREVHPSGLKDTSGFDVIQDVTASNDLFDGIARSPQSFEKTTWNAPCKE
jgi:hypothetical protein